VQDILNLFTNSVLERLFVWGNHEGRVSVIRSHPSEFLVNELVNLLDHLVCEFVDLLVLLDDAQFWKLVLQPILVFLLEFGVNLCKDLRQLLVAFAFLIRVEEHAQLLSVLLHDVLVDLANIGDQLDHILPCLVQVVHCLGVFNVSGW